MARSSKPPTVGMLWLSMPLFVVVQGRVRCRRPTWFAHVSCLDCRRRLLFAIARRAVTTTRTIDPSAVRLSATSRRPVDSSQPTTVPDQPGASAGSAGRRPCLRAHVDPRANVRSRLPVEPSPAPATQPYSLGRMVVSGQGGARAATRTNIEVDEDDIEAATRLDGTRNKIEAVDPALRRLVGARPSVDEAIAVEGLGRGRTAATGQRAVASRGPCCHPLPSQYSVMSSPRSSEVASAAACRTGSPASKLTTVVPGSGLWM